MSDGHTPRRQRVKQALTGPQTEAPSSFAVSGVLAAVRNVPAMKCPVCETTLQPTDTSLYRCPNDDNCAVVHVDPTSND